MPDTLNVRVDGKIVEVPEGTTAAVAAFIAGTICRNSSSGQPRTPFCGMGTCFECLMAIDGVRHRRSCQVLCKSGMEIATDE
jgi:predicted molibdopterin-dependent oxidoreductase YjgC